MASGKKNYFRHSFHARNDDKIAGLINKHGKEAYFHFFALIEVCAEIASDKMPDDFWFHFHPRTLSDALLVKKWTLINHLSVIQQWGLCGVSVEHQPSISGASVEVQRVSVHLPNLPKYMGRYESNAPNKRKEKEIKVNESKGPTPILSKKAKPEKTPTLIFEVEPLQLDEDIEASHDAVTVLTMLNSICFRAFRPTDFNLKYINARLKEKYSIEDFKKVIDYKHKEWSVKPEMKEYLQPSTLFGNKFDQYLNQALGSETLSQAEEDALIAKYFPGA